MPLSTFPTSIDVINDPSSTNTLADAGYEHDLLHGHANDAISAIETKIGINGSPVSSTLDYILHNHAHTGSDGSVPVSTGAITSINAISGSPSSVPVTITGAASQTADLFDIKNSAGTVIAKIGPDGTITSAKGLIVQTAGATLLYASGSEVSVRNGATLKGYAGEGTSEQYAFNASGGSLKLGGAPGTAALLLNAYNATQLVYTQANGKNAANAGGVQWFEVSNADSANYTARSWTLASVLLKAADASQGPFEQFIVAGHPTYDGILTDTKSIAMSVVPGLIPTLVPGAVVIAGKLNVSDIASFQVPPVFPLGSYGPATATSGVDARFARFDHSHGALPANKAAFTKTSGNYTITSTAWAILDPASDLVLPAKAGDWIEISMNAMWNWDPVTGYLDVETTVGGAFISSFGSAKTGTDLGAQGWMGNGGAYDHFGGSLMKQMTSADIDAGGNVTLRLVGKASGSTGKILFASADQPFHWHAKNLGQP